jgi:acyl-CoA synthetase (AMP-forming)/AMP-acid ligase II
VVLSAPPPSATGGSAVRGGQGPRLDDLRAYCVGRLADYKAPDALVVLESLPLTPMMKVDKRSLVESARAAAAARPAAARRATSVGPRSEAGELTHEEEHVQ